MKPRFRLWQLFAFTAMAAIATFVALHLGFLLEWQPATAKTGRHFHVIIWWNGGEVFGYDSWPWPDDPPSIVANRS